MPLLAEVANVGTPMTLRRKLSRHAAASQTMQGSYLVGYNSIAELHIDF